MKQIIFLFALSFGFGILTAQEETLFNRAKIIGAFGAPIVQYSFHGDDVTTSVGGGGALIIDHFFIGGYGIGTVNEDIFQNIERIELAHGGFWIGAVYPSNKLVHLYSSVRIGWGGVDIDLDNEDFDSFDGVFVVEPEAGLELNVFKFFRIAATVGYRYVDGINESSISGLDKNAFNGVIGGLTFRFGGFGHRRW